MAWFYQMQYKFPLKTSELYSLYNFYIVNAYNSSCSKNKREHKYSKYIWISSSWLLVSPTPRGSLCRPLQILPQKSSWKGSLPTDCNYTKKQCSIAECCKQWEGSVHRDLCCQNWGPHCCNRETVILVAEVGNVDTGSLHSPALLGTPQSCFLCYPLLYRGPYKTSFCSPWVAVRLQTGSLLTWSQGGSHKASKVYSGSWGAGATCAWVKGQGTPF